MAYRPENHKTPWQKVHAKFSMSPAALARELGRHRSKVSRALRDEKGLITGRDQEMLLSAAKRLGVNLTASDLTPDQR